MGKRKERRDITRAADPDVTKGRAAEKTEKTFLKDRGKENSALKGGGWLRSVEEDRNLGS